jgi:hypothetical protein
VAVDNAELAMLTIDARAYADERAKAASLTPALTGRQDARSKQFVGSSPRSSVPGHL